MSEHTEAPLPVEDDAPRTEPLSMGVSAKQAGSEDAHAQTLSDEDAQAPSDEDAQVPSDDDVEALSAQQILAEHNALALAFDDVRAQSAESELTRPSRWSEIGIVPEHLTPEDFEMMVYEYWEDEQATCAASNTQPEPAPVFRTATRAVGVPRMFGASAAQEKVEAPREAESEAPREAEVSGESFASAKQEIYEESEQSEATIATADASEATSLDDSEILASNTADNPFANLKIPAGYRLVELEGEYVLVEDEQAQPVELVINCKHISALVGARSYYLYDSAIMTDTYAHWAFLAAEDNPVVTFADCVREDSRVYPRPLAASSLKNPPFNMSDEGIAQTWSSVQASGEYPDIEQTVASNGDVYFYSTKYLSAPYAASLAEWDAVERRLCL